MLMTRAWKRGVAGVVTDGGLRDGHVLSQLPFPTYAAAITITTRAAWHHVADLQVPIGCAGVAVYPGDVIVADRDGVLVVPRSLAAEIAQPSLDQEKLEAFVATKIRAGEPLAGNSPPGEETIANTRPHLPEPLRRDARQGQRDSCNSFNTGSQRKALSLEGLAAPRKGATHGRKLSRLGTNSHEQGHGDPAHLRPG